MNDIPDNAESLGTMENLGSDIKPRVVVVSSSESLLGRALEGIVTDERDWMILRVPDGQNLPDLVQKIEETNPNVVIISRNECGEDKQLLTRLPQVCPELNKVILVSLSENIMQVYCRQKIQVKSVQDLFSEVEKQFSKL